MVKRICPVCGTDNYSSDSQGLWRCIKCDAYIWYERNENAEGKEEEA